MPYSQRVDGLDELRAELKLIPDRILDEGEKIVGKAMSQIKKGTAQRVRADRPAHLPHLVRTSSWISYDVDRRGQVIRGEIGADMEKEQGGLDLYYTYGTAHSAPHNHWWQSLDEEMPRFEKYADELLERLIR
jgi:hypothetical protein